MLQGRRPEAAIRAALACMVAKISRGTWASPLLPARHVMNKIGMSKPNASHKIIFNDNSDCRVASARRSCGNVCCANASDSYDRMSITTLWAVGSEAKVKARPSRSGA
jgi:hypothetical protein